VTVSIDQPSNAAPPDRREPRARRGFTVARASRMVAAMKMLLPATALCLVALVVIWPQLLRDPTDIVLRGQRISVSDADTLKVANPRFVGVDDKDQPYEIVALSATQESESSDAVHLEQPQAELMTESGAWMTLTAGYGIWNKRAEAVDLAGGVALFHDAGHQLGSETARIQLGAGTAESDDPTIGQSPGGNIHGEGFRLFDRGARIVFTGKAKAVLFGAGADG